MAPSTFHLSFLDDVVEQFGHAFERYERLASENPNPHHLVDCVRALYLAIEKGCKDALARIDPYLVLSKIDRNLLMQIRSDMTARPVPTIFCSRARVETLGMMDTWEALRQVQSAPDIDRAVEEDFDRALKQLSAARNRAHHGEVYEEPEALRAVVTHVLAGFGSVVAQRNPDWLATLYKKHAQLQSRLRGIQRKVGADWQVLCEYLRDHTLELVATMWTQQLPGASTVRLVLESPMQGSADVPLSSAEGLFGMYITEDQSAARRELRRASTEAVGSPLFFASLFEQTRSKIDLLLEARPDPAIPVLDTGRLHVSLVPVWLSRGLGTVFNYVFLNASLRDLDVVFDDRAGLTGTVVARLESAYPGNPNEEAIRLSGSAELLFEALFPSTEERESPAATRQFRLSLKMSVLRADAAGDSEAEASEPTSPIA